MRNGERFRVVNDEKDSEGFKRVMVELKVLSWGELSVLSFLPSTKNGERF